MKQVKLCVEILDESNNLLAPPAYSKTISDHTDANLGPLEFVEAAPLKGCTRGSGKVIMTSDKQLPKDIEPFFEIWNDLHGWVADHTLLKQPDSFKRGTGNWISFPLPSQQKDISKLNLRLRVRCIGKQEQRISNFFNFKYFQHKHGCQFCDDSDSVMEKAPNGKQRKPPQETQNLASKALKNLTIKKPQTGLLENTWTLPDVSQNDLDIFLLNQDAGVEDAPVKRMKPSQKIKTSTGKTAKIITNTLQTTEIPDLSQNNLDKIIMSQEEMDRILMPPPAYVPDFHILQPQEILSGREDEDDCQMMTANVTCSIQEIPNTAFKREDEDDCQMMTASVACSIQEFANTAFEDTWTLDF